MASLPPVECFLTKVIPNLKPYHYCEHRATCATPPPSIKRAPKWHAEGFTAVKRGEQVQATRWDIPGGLAVLPELGSSPRAEQLSLSHRVLHGLHNCSLNPTLCRLLAAADPTGSQHQIPSSSEPCSCRHREEQGEAKPQPKNAKQACSSSTCSRSSLTLTM